MKTMPNRIREHREAQDLTIEQLAERADISVSYLSRLEKGERNLSVKNMGLIASALSLSPRDLLVDDQDQGSSNTISVMGRIGAGAEILPEAEQVPPEGLYEIETMFPIPAGAIAFEVAGDSMWPRYDPGDIIICWQVGVSPDEVVGWEAAVMTGDGRRYLKRILRGQKKNTFDLESHNAAPIRGVHLQWVASVQSVIRSGQWKKLTEAGRRNLLRKMTSAA